MEFVKEMENWAKSQNTKKSTQVTMTVKKSTAAVAKPAQQQQQQQQQVPAFVAMSTFESVDSPVAKPENPPEPVQQRNTTSSSPSNDKGHIIKVLINMICIYVSHYYQCRNY